MKSREKGNERMGGLGETGVETLSPWHFGGTVLSWAWSLSEVCSQLSFPLYVVVGELNKPFLHFPVSQKQRLHILFSLLDSLGNP